MQNKFTQISNTKIKGKLYTQLSPKKQTYNKKVCTWLKRIQKTEKDGYLCIDLNSLSVVEEHCIREEAQAKAGVDLIQERMLA